MTESERERERERDQLRTTKALVSETFAHVKDTEKEVREVKSTTEQRSHVSGHVWWACWSSLKFMGVEYFYQRTPWNTAEFSVKLTGLFARCQWIGVVVLHASSNFSLYWKQKWQKVLNCLAKVDYLANESDKSRYL